MTERLPKTLYHYCSVNTFFNIIENNSIWLSDVEKSNDTLELAYIKKEYSNYVRLAVFSFIAYHKKNNIAYDEHRLNTILQVLSELTNLPISKSWVFCLSEKGDLLSQWRGYADDGYGVSVGFDRKYMKTITDLFLFEETDITNTFEFKKINYSKDEMNQEISKLINPLEIGSCLTIDEFEEKLTFPLAQIDSLSPFFKSDSFKEEREWRLALTAIIGDNCEYSKLNAETSVAKFKKFQYCAINKNIVSHFELELKEPHKAINKIILGPKCKISVDEMKYYLISKGLLKNIDDKSIIIETSSSSYR